GKRVTRETPRDSVTRETSTRKKSELTPHRERTEWRDITALVLRMAADDELPQKTIAHMAERFGGRGQDAANPETLPRGAPPAEQTLLVVFGDQNPDGRDTESAAACALRLSRAASAAAAEEGRSTSVAIAVSAGRVLVDLGGALLHDEHYARFVDGAQKLAK